MPGVDEILVTRRLLQAESLVRPLYTKCLEFDAEEALLLIRMEKLVCPEKQSFLVKQFPIHPVLF